MTDEQFNATHERKDAMTQAYRNPTRANDPYALPDVEVWYAKDGDIIDAEGDACPAGWYWWTCFPGCIPKGDPEGDPMGPFDTEADALADAQSYHD